MWQWQVSLFSHWISLLLNVGFFFTKCNSRFLLNDTQFFFFHFRVVRYVDGHFLKKEDFLGLLGFFFWQKTTLLKKKISLNRAEHISFFEVVWSNLSSFWWLQMMMTLLEKKKFFKNAYPDSRCEAKIHIQCLTYRLQYHYCEFDVGKYVTKGIFIH